MNTMKEDYSYYYECPPASTTTKQQDFTKYLVFLTLALSCYIIGISIGQWLITDLIISIVFNSSVTFVSIVCAAFAIGISIYSLSFNETVQSQIGNTESKLLKSYQFTFTSSSLAMCFAALSSLGSQNRIIKIVAAKIDANQISTMSHLQDLWFNMPYWKAIAVCQVLALIGATIVALKVWIRDI